MKAEKSVRQVETMYPQAFESIRRETEDGEECWYARELSRVLGYSVYRNFDPVINRSKTDCRNSGQPVSDHYEDVLAMFTTWSGARRQVVDVRLSRYACYLIVQNGDPSKPGIASGQTYFAEGMPMSML